MNRSLKIFLIILGSVLVFLVLAKKLGWIGGESGIKVSVEEATKRTLIETVTASGKIQPEVEVSLSSEVSGEIIELPIVEGQIVTKGDLLIRINPAVYQSSVQRLEAALSQAQSNLNVSKAQLIETEQRYKRNQALFNKGAISRQDWETLQSQYEVAKLNVESAKFSVTSANASLNEARENLNRTTIYAPIDGVVSALNVEIGERVVGTAQMQGTELMRVSDFGNMEVVVDVNENDIVRVDKGDTAIVEVDAFLGKTFKGVVTEIASSADLVNTSADQVTNFEVKIRILRSSYKDLLKGEKSESPFRPGMTASVDIQTEVMKNALSVPIQAVTTRSDTSANARKYDMRNKEGAMEVVFLAGASGKAEIRLVKTGIQDDQYIQILSGIKLDDPVISSPYSVISKELRKGDRIEVTEKDKLFEEEE